MMTGWLVSGIVHPYDWLGYTAAFGDFSTNRHRTHSKLPLVLNTQMTRLGALGYVSNINNHTSMPMHDWSYSNLFKSRLADLPHCDCYKLIHRQKYNALGTLKTCVGQWLIICDSDLCIWPNTYICTHAHVRIEYHTLYRCYNRPNMRET